MLALVVVTIAITKALVPARATGPLEQQQIPGSMTERVIGPDVANQVAVRRQNMQMQLPMPNETRTAGMEPMRVEVQGNNVLINGKAKIYETQPANYIWLLRVYKHGTKELLSEHHYLDAVNSLAEGQFSMTPEFEDMINLRPGRYRVELSIYGVAPNFPLKTVKFGEKMRDRALIDASWHEIIEISR